MMGIATVAMSLAFYFVFLAYKTSLIYIVPKTRDFSYIFIYTVGSLTEPEPRRFFPKASTGKIVLIMNNFVIYFSLKAWHALGKS